MRPRLSPRQVAFLRVLARKGGLGAYEVELAVDEASALGLPSSSASVGTLRALARRGLVEGLVDRHQDVLWSITEEGRRWLMAEERPKRPARPSTNARRDGDAG